MKIENKKNNEFNFLSECLSYLKEIDNSDSVVLKKFTLGMLKNLISENEIEILQQNRNLRKGEREI